MESVEKKRKHAEAQRRWRKAHPEKAKAALRRYRDKRAAQGLVRVRRNPATAKAQHARYYARNKTAVRARQGGRLHGISPEEYAERRARPCEICGVLNYEPGKRGSGMHVDHDHITNKLRGTLCARCNRGLGMFDDSPERLSAAATYVLCYRSRKE